MCGFVGLRDQSGLAESQLQDLCLWGRDKLTHRGPDDGGLWLNVPEGVALGHRRLSILDLSPFGHQPMQSSCGRYVVAYNGEVYNFSEMRAELEAYGDGFRGHSDTEVLLAAVARWGVVETCRRANGMFAFALWDGAARTLTLGRDRFGQKPLYWSSASGRVAFASELKGLLPMLRQRPVIDEQAVALFLRHGYIPAPYSIYKGVAKLPPGTLLTVASDGSAGQPVPYWSAPQSAATALANPYQGSESEAIDALEDLLDDAVGKCMVADVPLGAFLSGGVDSSAVVALMQRRAARPVKTFSIGFAEAAFDESAHAAAVARHLGTEHTELKVRERDALSVIPAMPAIYDEPFADSSQIPTYLLAKLAREHVTVSLSGDGGDEMFCGYNRYLWGGQLARLVTGVPAPIRRLGCRLVRTVPVAAWDTLGRLAPAGRVAHLGDKLHKLAGIAGASDAATAYLGLTSLGGDPSALTSVAEPVGAVLPAARSLGQADFVLRMMLADSVTYLPDDILVKVDRASMAVSLEARVPLLDHRVFDFAWSLPLAMKLRGKTGKWLLRKVLYRHVPEGLINRPKMGFGIPIGAWLKGDLRDWGNELLSVKRLEQNDLLNVAATRKLWTEHLAGQRNWSHQLWAILMLQAWLEANR